MTSNLKIDYIEFSSPKLEITQDFFAKAFDWKFVEFGDNYRDIQNAGTSGGITRSDGGISKAPLIVLVSDDLAKALTQVKSAGGEITKEIFKFPGGKRFEFREPGGTEMAVWCKD